MRGVIIKLVRVKPMGDMTVRKGPCTQRGAKITPIVTCLGYVSRDAVCRRQVGGCNILSKSAGDTPECAYVFDEANATELLGATIPHRTLDWITNRSFLFLLSHSPAALAGKVSWRTHVRAISES